MKTIKDISNINRQYFEDIFSHCMDNNTGTFFIATKNNRSCQISIHRGEVTAASMGRLKGDTVAVEVFNETIKFGSFKENMIFPHVKEARVLSTAKFLKKLGFQPEIHY